MVKTILKRNNILLSQFASDLNISRPTLDTYIKNYDKGIPLSNNLYQKIFDFLFGDVLISADDFSKRYSYVITNYGNSVDIQSLSSSSSTNQYSLYTLIGDGSMSRLLSDDESDALAELIVLKDPLLLNLLKYNLLLSNKDDIRYLEDIEKMLLSRIFESYKKIGDGDLTYNEEQFNFFVEHVDKKNKTMSKDEIKKVLFTKVNEIINETVDSNNNLTIEEIIKKLNEKSMN